MNKRYARLLKILDIIKTRPIETQEELSYALKDIGIDISQPTLSRDIEILNLRKQRRGNKRIYVQPDSDESYIVDEKFVSAMRNSYISCEIAMNMLVIKTVPNMSTVVKQTLDECGFLEIMGMISDYDTVICVCRSASNSIKLKKKIEELLYC